MRHSSGASSLRSIRRAPATAVIRSSPMNRLTISITIATPIATNSAAGPNHSDSSQPERAVEQQEAEQQRDRLALVGRDLLVQPTGYAPRRARCRTTRPGPRGRAGSSSSKNSRCCAFANRATMLDGNCSTFMFRSRTVML